MKKYLSAVLAVMVIAGIYGCGDNKTKEKLFGTSVVTSTNITGGSYTSNPTASSVTALYKVSFLGAGAGNFSYSAPRRGAPQKAPSGDEGTGLGTPNANGEYVISDPMGMNIKLKFQKNSQTVYMDMSKTFSSGGLYLYPDQDLTATPRTTLGEGFDPLTIASWPQYIASLWIKASDGKPLAWYTINSLMSMSTDLEGLSAWMMETAFPDSLVNTITGRIPGGSISMTMTTTMVQRPTNASPSTMTGSGTITFDTGEVLTVSSNMSIGENGPVSGTQTFSSTSGQSGTMTFASDGSMTGTVSMNGVVVATVNIKADGSGTYTDVATGKTYSITDAKPK